MVIYFPSSNCFCLSNGFDWCYGYSGDYYVYEDLKFVDQWTWGHGRCMRYYQPEEHEFRRARKLACRVIETYRDYYIKKYGMPPNPMLLMGTMDPAVHNIHTEKVNRRLLGNSYLQLKLQFDS